MKDNEVVTFKGNGKIGGKDVEIHFQTNCHSDNPHQIKGKYIIMFKKPNSKWIRNETHYETFEGVCENFVPSGKCAFSNDNGEMLIVHYDDIIQMKLTK